jgi:hypothetical protein
MTPMILNIVVCFQVPNGKLNATSVAQEVVEFSKQLALITTPVEERRDLQAQAQELPINALQNISDSKLDFSKNNPNRVSCKILKINLISRKIIFDSLTGHNTFEKSSTEST